MAQYHKYDVLYNPAIGLLKKENNKNEKMS